MTQTALGYTTRGYQTEDEVPVLELLKTSLGESSILQRTHALWEWKHIANPFGTSPVRLACDEAGAPIGMRAFMRWQFLLERGAYNAVRAVDTATHPDHRRMGIFSVLTNQLADEVRDTGVDLIFNTPNGYSLPGYLKMGWQQAATVHPLLKVLDYPGFALGMVRGKLGKGGAAQPSDSKFFKKEPSSVSELLNRRQALENLLAENDRFQTGIRTQRSWEYLRWRYGQHPTIPYWAVFSEEEDSIQSCAIFRTNNRFGLKEIVLCELFLSRPEIDLGVQLLKQLRSLIKADYLITYFSGGTIQRQVIDRWGFHSVPRKGMYFAVRPLQQCLSKDPLIFNNWNLSMGDLELL